MPLWPWQSAMQTQVHLFRILSPSDLNACILQSAPSKYMQGSLQLVNEGLEASAAVAESRSKETTSRGIVSKQTCRNVGEAGCDQNEDPRGEYFLTWQFIYYGSNKIYVWVQITKAMNDISQLQFIATPQYFLNNHGNTIKNSNYSVLSSWASLLLVWSSVSLRKV